MTQISKEDYTDLEISGLFQKSHLFHQYYSINIPFFLMGSHHFNRKSIVPCSLEDINATGLHRRPCFISMLAKTGWVALFTEPTRTGAHAPCLVVTIKKNLNFETNNGWVENFCPFPLF
jgi:hypothetical protein